MNGSERRRLLREARRRVLAGEPRAPLFADLVAAGVRPGEAARLLASTATPTARRHARWLWAALLVLLPIAAASLALSPAANPRGDQWFFVGVAAALFIFGLPFVALLRWSATGCTGATIAPLFAVAWTLWPLHGGASSLGLAEGLQLALYVVVFVLALVVQRFAFPDLGWTGPRRDEQGEYRFAD